MHVEISARKIPMTPAIRSFIHKHVGERLAHFAAQIASVHVELRDKNGRRGGGDKRCRIRIALPGSSHVLTEDVRASVRDAIRHAAGRAASQVHVVLRRMRPLGSH